MPKKSQAILKHHKRNYFAHALEGGVFMGGMAFISAETVLPSIVKSLGGPVWLIAFMPVMMAVGFIGPPLLTAHVVEKWKWLKPPLMIVTVFQRLPFLAAGVILLFFGKSMPVFTLVIVAIAPLLSGFLGGLTMTAWMGLISKTILPQKRASMWALRLIVRSLIGISAGRIVKVILDTHPGPDGYGRLFLIAFAFLVVSFFVLSFVKEGAPQDFSKPDDFGLLDNLKDVPKLIWRDRRFFCYLFANFFGCGIFILIPFLGIHALKVTQEPQSFLGVLLTMQMVGTFSGNIIGGFLGDRFGGRLLLLISRAGFILMGGWAAVAISTWEFNAIFFFFGFSMYIGSIGKSTIALEICPKKRQATYLAILATSNLPGMLLAAGISGLVWKMVGNFTVIAFLTSIWLAISLALVLRIKEPRYKH